MPDKEWEHLYKTNFEVFWDLVVKEGDLTKLPTYLVETRSEEPLYGKEARDYILYHLKQSISPWNDDTIRNRQWVALLRIKHELEEKSQSKVCMLDVIREYESHIKY